MTVTFADGRKGLVLTVYADTMIEEIKNAVSPNDKELSVKFNGRVQSRRSQLTTLSPKKLEVRLEFFKGQCQLSHTLCINIISVWLCCYPEHV